MTIITLTAFFFFNYFIFSHMQNMQHFNSLLEQCADLFLQFLVPLDVNTLIEGMSLMENTEYSITKIKKTIHATVDLSDIMSNEAIEERFQTIIGTPEYKHHWEAYFNYFAHIGKYQISLYKHDTQSSLIHYILRTEYLSESTEIDNSATVTSTILPLKLTTNNRNYRMFRYSNQQLLNIQSNQIMRFEHKRLIDWNHYLMRQRKESLIKHGYHPRGDVIVELDENHCPKFYQYDVEFGYLSSNFTNCATFLLEKGKGVNSGNAARTKAFSFVLSNVLLSSIFEYDTFIALFDRLDQTGYDVPDYGWSKCRMKLFWTPKLDPTFLVSLDI
eukprot:8965_1